VFNVIQNKLSNYHIKSVMYLDVKCETPVVELAIEAVPQYMLRGQVCNRDYLCKLCNFCEVRNFCSCDDHLPKIACTY
jgi:hypothetical protein